MLYFVGLGLYSCEDLSIRALRVLKKCSKIYVDLYTSIVPQFTLSEFANILEKSLGSEIVGVTRRELENDIFVEKILEESSEKDVAIVVPGDPFIATTHLWIRLEAEKRKIPTAVIHSTSILTAAISETGLHPYKFGKCVTIVYPDLEKNFIPYSVYETLVDNIGRGLHTLMLLDLRLEEKIAMTIADAINVLELLEEKIGKGIISSETLGVALSRIGSPDSKIVAGPLYSLRKINLGPPPHSLIIPGELHFTEEEALIVLAKASIEAVRTWKKKVRDLRNILNH